MMDAYQHHYDPSRYSSTHYAANYSSSSMHYPSTSSTSSSGYYAQPRALPIASPSPAALLPPPGSMRAHPASAASSVHSSPDTGAFLDSAAPYGTPMNGIGLGALSMSSVQSTTQGAQNAMHVRSHSNHSSHSNSASTSSNSSPAGSASPLPSSSNPTHNISLTSRQPASSHNNAVSSATLTTNGVSIGSALTIGTPLTRSLTHKETELLAHLDRLKFFLATAPSRWADAEVPRDDNAELGLGMNGGAGVNGGAGAMGTPLMPHPNTHPALNRFLLPSGEYVTCVLWSGLYHITGTDIVRALVFRFEAFGRPVRNMKKFEEGVFSDLRNLKPGTDACLEEPKSPFLDLLFKYQCIRTQKKQKVFYWFSVPHDRLFLDALERDLKREKMGLEPTTHVVGEPAQSFTYDSKRTLYEQFSKAQGAQEGEGELETAVRRAEEAMAAEREQEQEAHCGRQLKPYGAPNTPFFNMFSLFEGSPSYKQRRKKGPRSGRSALATRDSTSEDERVPSANVADVVEDVDGEMSAAAMFDAQANLGAGGNRQAQAHRQAENQRLVQAQHIALLNQRAGSVARDAATRGAERTGDVLSQAGGRKTKAYVCPLFSCQRLFKRLEHMKRHYRMHTMERPFQCELCQRRFSRADNLAQHVRTHSRESTSSSGVMDSPSDAEAEDGVDQTMYASGEQYEQVDFNACEVEVAAEQAMQVEDDDMSSSYGGYPTAPNGYYNLSGTGTPQFANVVMSPENSPRLSAGPLTGDWSAAHAHTNSLPNVESVNYDYSSAHPSPAFSTASAPSSQARYATTYGTSAGAYHMQSEYPPSFSAPSSAGSVSAPAHKQTFDHASLFPPALGLQGLSSSGAGVAGPVRRYRSVTPTIARSSEQQIRRPSSTTNTLESSPLAGGGPRAYHPYAQYSNPAIGSAHSSPAPYQAQLEYTQSLEQQHPQQYQQAHSPPNASVFQEDLQTLIGLDATMGPALGGFEDVAATATGIAASGATNYADVYQDQTAVQTQAHYEAGPGTTAETGYYANMGALDNASQYAENGNQYHYDVNASGN
ncbi:STE-domain-containing protein [Phellopilus nigrolimitatus]|nr:STE-domain-containing protein [Phellopilus nigrolimitatus]